MFASLSKNVTNYGALTHMSYKQVFYNELRRCFNGNVPDKLLVALSGGVDSMCLTYLLADYKRTYQPLLDIHALTIDHGYRNESTQEAKEVGEQVSQWGIKHQIKKLDYGRNLNEITNFEEVARTLRYEAFQDSCHNLGIGSILVAHNLDDQIETFLQRLQMNSTLFGLASLKGRSPFPSKPRGPVERMPPLTVCRPVLLLSKPEIIQVCQKNQVNWFEDKTNADPTVTKRNWLRHHLPNIDDKKHPLSREQLLRSINDIGNTREVLESHIDKLDKYIRTYGNFKFDKAQAAISFTVPLSFWSKLHESVAGRWLYNLMYPISSSDNYHWSYAKIERLAIPRINEFLTSPSNNKLSLTYLNVKLDIESADHDTLNIQLSRQPTERRLRAASTIDLHLTESPLEWVLFNNIWWLSISDKKARKVRIEQYNSSMKAKLSKTFPKVRRVSRGIPIVINDTNDEVLALPTLGSTVPGVNVEWYVKAASNAE